MSNPIQDPGYVDALGSAKKKVKLIDSDIAAYGVRSILAGLYLALICFLFWSLKENLHADPSGAVIASLFFGVGLFTILVTKSELFTSNAMYMTQASLAKQNSWGKTIQIWIVCYAGNLIGSIMLAGALYFADILDALPADHAIFHGAEHKIHQTSDAIFIKGILANWVVCLAVWVYLNLKDEATKFLSIISIVFIFLYLGFEHSIANMGTFSIALMSANNTITLAGAAYNLLWATLGNIVGGGIFIGAIYYWLNRETKVK